MKKVAETEDLSPSHSWVHADEVVQVHLALCSKSVVSHDLQAGVMATLTLCLCHLLCVSGGKAAEASSRSHRRSSCEIDQKQSSAESCRRGSPETS